MNNGFFDWLQYLLSFALVIALLLGSLWALRKLQSGAVGARGRTDARLKIVETLSVGPARRSPWSSSMARMSCWESPCNPSLP